MNAATIRLFHAGVYGWLALYMLAVVLLGDAAWVSAPVPLLASASGLFAFLQDGVSGLVPWSLFVISVLLLVLSVAMIQRHRWWLGLLVWFLFSMVTHRMWLASNGGIQLMENMLLWSALMSGGPSTKRISYFAFWAARLQLLLVYAAAAAHKFTGTTWLDGSAMLLVANDPAFHLQFLAGSPLVCKLITWSTLAFMTLFPLAVWWRPSRRFFLITGALFHLCTAIFMDIPQMGLAFIACYAIWLQEEEVQVIERRVRSLFAFTWNTASRPSQDPSR